MDYNYQALHMFCHRSRAEEAIRKTTAAVTETLRYWNILGLYFLVTFQHPLMVMGLNG